MHELYLIYSFAIRKLRLSANSQWAEICFSANKGVSESKDISVNSNICFSFSKYALFNYWFKFKPANVLVKPYRTTKHAQPFSLLMLTLIARWQLSRLSHVDANANPVCQTNTTYRPLYRGRTKNIISPHKWRCHGAHQCEPCLNIQFLPCTWGGSFDVYGRDFMSWAEYQRKGWL